MSKTVVSLTKYLWCLGVLSLCTKSGHSTETGPLHVQNRYPIYLIFLSPEPDTPRLVKTGHWLLAVYGDYTSVYINEQSRDWSVLMDMEMTVVSVGLTYGLTRHLNVAVATPWICMHAGFLDGPLATYHETFGFPDYDRPDRPENEFDYHMRKNGEDWVHGGIRWVIGP